MALKIYGPKATVNFWETHWQTQKLKKFFFSTSQSPLLPILLKYLPKNGKILEAGCGPGRWVFTLSQKSYQIIGIDSAKETIQAAKKAFPKLNLKTANLLNLPFKKASFKSVICLGVLEHIKSPKKLNLALKEINQVLKSKGLLFCSVPYYNPIRVIKNFLNLYPKNGRFYQYAFGAREFSQRLENQGFKILKIIPFDSYIGIKQELFPKLTAKIYKKLKPENSPPVNKKRKKSLKKYLFFILKKILETYPSRLVFSHMLLFIIKKEI
jgi:ubiquinone/menaquinone biosynthesis C-methylase UbiE